MEEHNYTVYMHVNKINNKKYIGITGRKPELRWQNGTAYKRNPHFNSAILKYGWNGFEHKILFENLKENDAKSKEIELISKFNTMNNRYGYNMTIGGEGISGYKFELSTIEQMSINNSGENNPMYGRTGSKHPLYGKKGKLSATYGRKLTEQEKENLHNKHQGKKLSEDHKLHMRQSQKKGKDNVSAVQVNQYDLSNNYIKHFGSVSDASRDLDIDKSNICKVCNGKAKSAGGFIWKYADVA